MCVNLAGRAPHHTHLVTLNSIKQDLLGLAQVSLHLHVLPGQLDSVERPLCNAARRLHGLS